MGSNEQHLKQQFVEHLIKNATRDIELALLKVGQNVSLDLGGLYEIEQLIMQLDMKSQELRGKVGEQFDCCAQPHHTSKGEQR